MNNGLIKQRLHIGTRFVMRNEIFEIAHADQSVVRYCSTAGGRPRGIPVLSFWQLEEEGVIGFLDDGIALQDGEEVVGFGLHQLTERQREELERRMLYVKTLLMQDYRPQSRNNRLQTIRYVAEKCSDPHPPSLATISRWTNRFLKCGGNPKSLVPRHDQKGPRYTKLALEVELLIGAKLRTDYLDEQRASGKQLHCNVVGHLAQQGWLNEARKPPSQSTIYRRIKALDPYVVTLKRFGKRTADMRHRAAGAGLELSRPMEVAMIDGHLIDVLVIDPVSGEVLGRPYLVCIFDVYTRCVVGWHISLMPFCATTALAAIKHMCSRDPNIEPGGVPENLLPDNGADFASDAVRNLCRVLCLHILPAKARCPDDKAHLERFFRTVNEQLVHMILGTTFSNPNDRGEYDSVKKAAGTLSDLRNLFDKWLRTVYEVHIHSGTGRAPKLDWRDNQSQWPIAHHSALEMDALARVTYQRRISGGRVLVDHLYYKSDALATLEAKGMRDVTVAVNELDLGFVYVTHINSPQMLIRADAVKSRYTFELTKYEHDIAKKKLAEKTKSDLAELGEYAYEIARWELWNDLHALKNARSSRRLAALRQQHVDRLQIEGEVKQSPTRKLSPDLSANSPDVNAQSKGPFHGNKPPEIGAASGSLSISSMPRFDVLDI